MKCVFVILTLVCVWTLSYQRDLGEARLPRQPRPPPSPRPPPGGGEETQCERESMRPRNEIQCNEDGTYASIQCMGPMCFCVNNETGMKINDMTFPRMEPINCTQMIECPASTCVMNCRDGYRVNENNCRLCECNAPPTPMMCETVRDVAIDDNCSCDCIETLPTAPEPRPGPGPGPGPRPRPRPGPGPGPDPRQCPTCNTTCNDMKAVPDTSCAVTSQEGCAEGTTLRSVGPRGSAECIPDLAINEECGPERGPGRRGPGARSIGDSPPPCQEGLVCNEVSIMNFICVNESTTRVCDIARVDDPTLRCDSDGLFEPLQCSSVIGGATTVGATTAGATTAGATTAGATTAGVTTAGATTVGATTAGATTAGATAAGATAAGATTVGATTAGATTAGATTAGATTAGATTAGATTVGATTAGATTAGATTAGAITAGATTAGATTAGATTAGATTPVLMADDITAGKEIEFCRCVSPDGITVAGTDQIGGVRPDCTIALRHCHIRGEGRRMFRVEHGELYKDERNCRTCECRNGNPTAFCSPPDDCPTKAPPSDCTASDGQLIPHDETRVVGCRTCGCKDGSIKCTRKNRRDCESDNNGLAADAIRDPCDTCEAVPPGPLCGPDGRNHISQCTAVKCAEIPAVLLQNGPCQSQNACEDHPCPDNENCIDMRGTVACIGIAGCEPNQLRICVNKENLTCPVLSNATAIDEREAICGSDGQTYQSLCHLIQATSNVVVLHDGPCNNPECQNGKVCATDGLTYENICELNRQAGVRLDYPGECLSDALSLEELDRKVLSEERCVSNENNCDILVYPFGDGVCPVCGGAVQIVLDTESLSEASVMNPNLRTVDTFTARLFDIDELKDISRQCLVEVSLTITGHLQVVFKTLARQYTSLCHQKSKELEALINDGARTTNGMGTQTTEILQSLPQVYSYVVVSSASDPFVREDLFVTEEPAGGAVCVEAACLIMLILQVVALVIPLVMLLSV